MIDGFDFRLVALDWGFIACGCLFDCVGFALVFVLCFGFGCLDCCLGVLFDRAVFWLILLGFERSMFDC